MAPNLAEERLDKFRCWPLKSLEELLGWIYDSVNPRAVGESISLRRCNPNNSPKTMICHDYFLCYKEDNYIDGLPNVDGFRVDHWAYIDVFVYFSHSFVTIPPVGWINCAHRNGVLMLGTFIMESEGGAKTCDQVLETPESATNVAGLLAAIAEAYNFDGWLMNFEVEIKPERMDNLLLFLRELQKGCRAKLGTQSMVVWYDSVKYKTGELDWQNELNGFNVPFYEVCDAVYLNYGWKSANLRASIMNAGTRPITDVYVGIDVYGRGTIGGGGFNSIYALQLLREFGFSVALFAPAWVKDSKDPNFMGRSYKFWDLLAPKNFCSKVASLPIDTNFCDGYFRNEQSENYFDLSCAQLQPHYCCRREDLPRADPVSQEVTNDDQLTSDIPFHYDTPISCVEAGLEIRFKPGLSEIRLFCTHIPMKQVKSIYFSFRLVGESGEAVPPPADVSALSLALHLRCEGTECQPSQSQVVRDIFIGGSNSIRTLAKHSNSISCGSKLELPDTDGNLSYEFSNSDKMTEDYVDCPLNNCDLIWISLMANNESEQLMLGLSNRFQLL